MNICKAPWNGGLSEALSRGYLSQYCVGLREVYGIYDE